MPKVLPEYLEQRRQQILDAAATCFSRRGFHQTTMQDICEEATLSPGAVYRYFRSKEEIIETMCERGGSRNLELIEGAAEEAEGRFLAVIDGLIDTFFGELADEIKSPEMCALNVEVISEAPRNPHMREALARNNNHVLSAFAEMIEQAQHRGEIDPALAPMSIAQVMLGLYQGLVTQKLVDPEIDIWRYADVIKSMFRGAFWLQATPERIETVKQPAALRH